MPKLVLQNDLLDTQTIRAAGSAPYGGAELGEVLATARLIDEDDLTSWFDNWKALGDRLTALAAAELAAGHAETARLAFWRASSYYRTAGVMMFSHPIDQRAVDANAWQTTAFRKGAELMAVPPEIVAIPYEGTTLPGYFFTVDGSGTRRATVISLGGYDSSAEEGYFYNVAAGLARGYNVLSFDGPGQGAALFQQGLFVRPDYDRVITPVVDWLLARSDVDADRIALIGASLGANLAPRAASAEHRLAACVADCGSFDMYAVFLDRMPAEVRGPFQARDQTTRTAVNDLLTKLMAQPVAGWSMRRGLAVHGVESPLAYVDTLPPYSLADHAPHITCPTFVCNGESDQISASAPQLVAALTCPHEFVTFTAAEGAGDHCESAARLLFHAKAFGWLDALLQPETS